MLAIPGNNSLKAGELNAMLCKSLAKERKLKIPAPLQMKTSPDKVQLCTLIKIHANPQIGRIFVLVSSAVHMYAS